MKKLCVNARDEMLVLELDKVAYFKAEGNYTQVVFISGQCSVLSLGLCKIEAMIADYAKINKCNFVRVGRSHIINQSYLFHIHVLRQKIVLSDYENHIHTIPISREVLKRYKSLLETKEKGEQEK